MSWSIYYRVRHARVWSDADATKLRAHLERWNEKLSALCTGYDVKGLLQTTDYRGSSKLPPSSRAADDYVMLVLALRELEQLFPGVEVTVGDDSQLSDHLRPGDIDLAARRAALVEDWGEDPSGLSPESDDPEEELKHGLHFDDDDEDREVAHLLERARRPYIESAAKDFAIWKNAQKNKKP